jgi:hypothetical protein
MMVMNAIDSVLAPTVNVSMGTTIGQNVAKNSRVDAPDTTRTTPVIPIPIDTMTATITPMIMVVTIGVRVGSVVVVMVPESNVAGTRVVGINVETEKIAKVRKSNIRVKITTTLEMDVDNEYVKTLVIVPNTKEITLASSTTYSQRGDTIHPKKGTRHDSPTEISPAILIRDVVVNGIPYTSASNNTLSVCI